MYKTEGRQVSRRVVLSKNFPVKNWEPMVTFSWETNKNHLTLTGKMGRG